VVNPLKQKKHKLLPQKKAKKKSQGLHKKSQDPKIEMKKPIKILGKKPRSGSTDCCNVSFDQNNPQN